MTNLKLIFYIAYFFFFNFIFNLEALAFDNPSRNEIKILNYNIYADFIQHKSNSITAHCTIKFKVLNTTISKLKFELFKLNVDSIKYNNSKISFIQNDTFITIQNSFFQNTEYELSIFYKGYPSKDASWGGFYFNGDYSYNMGVGFTAIPHPIGRYWYPCHDTFTSKALYEFNIKTISTQKALCNGILKQTTIDTTEKSIIWNWVSTNPLPTYLVSVAIAPYYVQYDNYNGLQGSIPITLAAVPTDTNQFYKSFINLKKGIDIFEKEYGIHRFERVGFNLVPFDAGAMEHAGNIAYPRYAANGTLNYETLWAHELSHHWWGNNVTCDKGSEMWLNEGWASYSESLFLEKMYGKLRYKKNISQLHTLVLRKAHLNDGKPMAVVGVDQNHTYGTHVYKKGADMVHSIRGILGDEAFTNACKAYMEHFKYNNANTDSFISIFQKYTNFNLTLWADFWLKTPGSAACIIEKHETQKIDNLYRCIVHTKQKLRFTSEACKQFIVDFSFIDDQNNNLNIQKVLSKEQSVDTFWLRIMPKIICLDFDEKLSDAITDFVYVGKNTGLIDCENALLKIQINSIDTTQIKPLIRVEHYWITPENSNSNISISRERYWKIDANYDLKTSADLIFNYDGSKPADFASGYLDNELFKNINEDSIYIFYRQTALQAWTIWPNQSKTIGLKTDKRGQILVKQMQKGEYTFGARQSSLFIDEIEKNICFSIQPNPGKEALIHIKKYIQNGTIKVFNANGQLEYTDSLFHIKSDTNLPLKINGSKGIYTIVIECELGIFQSKFLFE